MEGKFRYSSKLLIRFAVLLFISIPFMPTVYAAFFMFWISAAVVFVSFHIPGSCIADSEGVTIRKLLKTYRFAYRDIRFVETAKSQMGGTGGVRDFGIVVFIRLTIRTTDRTYTFHSINSYSLREHMDYPENLQEMIADMPFMRLEHEIRSHIQT